MRIYDGRKGVYRDETPEEIAAREEVERRYAAAAPDYTDTEAELLELAGDHEYRLCLLEMGVSANDL